MKFEINFGILKSAREMGHCVCDLSKPCPCDEFLEDQKCICGAYKKVEE